MCAFRDALEMKQAILVGYNIFARFHVKTDACDARAAQNLGWPWGLCRTGVRSDPSKDCQFRPEQILLDIRDGFCAI